MRNEQIVNVNQNELFVYKNKLFMHQGEDIFGVVKTDKGDFPNPSCIVLVLENADEVIEFENQTIPHIGPQAMVIFVPNFQTKKVMLRSIIFSNDWVADCQNADTKYKVWYATMNEALAILNREPITEV